jgi:hypothetical protein
MRAELMAANRSTRWPLRRSETKVIVDPHDERDQKDEGRRRCRGLARFADFGPLGDEPEAVEVHVRAAQHRGQPRARRARPLDPTAQARHRQAPAGSRMDRVSSNTSVPAAEGGMRRSVVGFRVFLVSLGYRHSRTRLSHKEAP